MPGGDRTGPIGQGPVTGRRLGYCAGYDSPGFAKGSGSWMGRGFSFGRGMGWGRGFGRGRGFDVPYQNYAVGSHWRAPVSKEDEIRFLKSEADALKQSQQDIEKRLKELEK
ncbi:MAG: DUF5320 domain-containing protein [Bacteroidales bacterium]|nr:DUF5320 domain-containing protein [Bacteroidales bacterium]